MYACTVVILSKGSVTPNKQTVYSRAMVLQAEGRCSLPLFGIVQTFQPLLLTGKELTHLLTVLEAHFFARFLLTPIKMTGRELLSSQGFTEGKLGFRETKWLMGHHIFVLVPEPCLTHDPEFHNVKCFQISLVIDSDQLQLGAHPHRANPANTC